MPKEECLFCQIASRQVPAEIVAEAEGLVAVNDIRPQAPVHLLIFPIEHLPTIADATPKHITLLGNAMLLANRLARERHVAQTGYRLVINCGAQAGQSVWHVHLHVLGGRSFAWPPG